MTSTEAPTRPPGQGSGSRSGGMVVGGGATTANRPVDVEDAPPPAPPTPPTPPPPPPRAKAERPPALAPRASKVVIKRLNAISVLKVSLLFYLSMFLILLVAAVLLWGAATTIGVVGNIESFMDSIGFEDFTFEPPVLLRGAALGGAVLVLTGTLGNVIMALLYNLISEVVGGVKVTLGEDSAGRRSV
jgi:hypothetical protein